MEIDFWKCRMPFPTARVDGSFLLVDSEDLKDVLASRVPLFRADHARRPLEASAVNMIPR
jgi:hypothetical protein